jgi:hypothetical protein
MTIRSERCITKVFKVYAQTYVKEFDFTNTVCGGEVAAANR